MYELHGLEFETELHRSISKGKFYIVLTKDSDLVNHVLKCYSEEFLSRFFLYMGYKFKGNLNNGYREYVISW